MRKNRQFQFLLYILVFLFVGIIGSNEVEAASCDNQKYQCITCTYADKDWEVTYTVSADGTGGESFVEGSPEYKEVKKHGFPENQKKDNITSTHFYDESLGKLKCPGVIYSTKSAAGFTFSGNKSGSAMQKKASSDNGKSYKSSLTGDVKKCTVHSFDKKTTCNLKIRLSKVEVLECNPPKNVSIDSTITADLFKDGCGSGLHLECHDLDSNCTLRYGEGYGSTEGEKTKTQTDYQDDIEKDTIKIGVLSCESLSGLTGFFSRIYKWVEIFMAVALVILTMLDYAKAVISSDDNLTKKANKHVVTRFIILVIIFVLPTLITIALNVFLPNYTFCLNF